MSNAYVRRVAAAQPDLIAANPNDTSLIAPVKIIDSVLLGDGYVLLAPERDKIAAFRSLGGGQKPVHAGLKVCYGTDEIAGTAHRLWSVLALPSQLPLVLSTPELVEQA